MTQPHLMTLAAYGITNAAELGADGKILSSQLPATVVPDTMAELDAAGGKLKTAQIPSTVALKADARYYINHYSPGVPADNAVMLVHCPSAAITLPINLAGSKIVSTVAATASTVLTIKKGASTVGTATFAISGTTATIAVASAVSLTTSDVLTIVNQADNDATLANLSFSLVATFT